MADNYNFGHPVKWCDKRQTWYFADSGKPNTMEEYRKRICPKCGLLPTKDGHDPCIANLPGVLFACCGHGVEEGYVWFENGVRVGGNFDICFHEPPERDNS